MELRLIACILMGYLLGSLNGALVVSRVLMHDDVRKKGSGNAGLTNFLRTYGGWITVLVLFIDLAKMVGACLLAKLILPEYPEFAKMLTGVCVQLGHILPVFFRFKGGKGILCSAALAAMMDWRIFAIIMTVFFILFFATRYVSLGSILASVAYGICFMCFYYREHFWVGIMGVAMAAIAIYMHRGNIQRLLKGEERKTHFHKSKNKEV